MLVDIVLALAALANSYVALSRVSGSGVDCVPLRFTQWQLLTSSLPSEDRLCWRRIKRTDGSVCNNGDGAAAVQFASQWCTIPDPPQPEAVWGWCHFYQLRTILAYMALSMARHPLDDGRRVAFINAITLTVSPALSYFAIFFS